MQGEIKEVVGDDSALVLFESVDTQGRDIDVTEPLSVPLQSLRRIFKVGDHVYVQRGVEKGRHGLVTNVDGLVLTFSDYRLSNHRLLINEAPKISCPDVRFVIRSCVDDC